MSKELRSEIERAKQIISRSSSIVVVSGAGVSTLSGIPDFRSPGIGLYSRLQHYNLPDPEAIFDLSYLQVNPKPFFDLAAELLKAEFQPSAGHYFIAKLEQERKLLRLYTQNIDGLDFKAGTRHIVECHGSFSGATCIRCQKSASIDDVRKTILARQIPVCDCGGIIKPNIVFFGEELPEAFLDNYERDLAQCDCFIAIGSSLVVQPVANLTLMVKPGIPRVLINRQATSYLFEIELLGDIGEICTQLQV